MPKETALDKMVQEGLKNSAFRKAYIQAAKEIAEYDAYQRAVDALDDKIADLAHDSPTIDGLTVAAEIVEGLRDKAKKRDKKKKRK